MEAVPRLALNEMDNDLYWQIIDSKKKSTGLLVISKSKEKIESNRLIAQAYRLSMIWLRRHLRRT
jgi:hypothetical protein